MQRIRSVYMAQGLVFLYIMILSKHIYVKTLKRSILRDYAHIAHFRNMSNLPYLMPSLDRSNISSTLVATTTVAQTIVAYATIFEARRRTGPGQAGWLVAKNLSGFQKSARCGRVLPVAGYHAQGGVSRQALLDQFTQRNSSNFSISSICVKSATFCIISAMRGRC